MNYGLYLSASGALTSMHRLDVLANNLANVGTVGFKPDMVVTRQRLPERRENPDSFGDPREMLEQLGGGVHLQPTMPDLRQGDLVTTHNDLDLAIQGEGFFLVSSGANPTATTTQLTRDGRFTLGPDGSLITATNGLHVLDENRRPIRLDSAAAVTIRGDGSIEQGGTVVAKVGLAAVPDPSRLARMGENTYQLPPTVGSTAPPPPASARIVQGAVEQSAVDPILALNALISAAKAAQTNLRMMQYQDNIMGQAINTFGRVA